PLFVALAAACSLFAAPAVAQAAATIEFQAGSSYGTNNVSHIVTVDVAGGPASGTAHVLWSLAHNSGGAASQTAVDISLDPSGVGSGSLTYTPSYPAPASGTDTISGVCVDSNTNGACDGGEPVPTFYTSHTVYLGEP